MEQPKSIEQIDWTGFVNDEQIKSKLEELVFETHVSNIQLRSETREKVQQTIKDYIALKGFPGTVSVSVSEPNEAGQRMIMGMANSPLTGEVINF